MRVIVKTKHPEGIRTSDHSIYTDEESALPKKGDYVYSFEKLYLVANIVWNFDAMEIVIYGKSVEGPCDLFAP